MTNRSFAFAADTKIGTTEQRNAVGTVHDRPESDNESYGYLPHFTQAIHDALICTRFWSHVRYDGPLHPVLRSRCWLWTANVVGRKHKNHPTHSQHGQFTYRLDGSSKQSHVYAHRFAWGVAHGSINDGLCVLHHCDTPPCVNVAHLFLGTQADNIRDAARKRRLTVPRTQKLSLLDRLTIHASDARSVDLAAEYGVSEAYIHLIRTGRFVGSDLLEQRKRA